MSDPIKNPTSVDQINLWRTESSFNVKDEKAWQAFKRSMDARKQGFAATQPIERPETPRSPLTPDNPK